MNSLITGIKKNKPLLVVLLFGLAFSLRLYGIEHQNIWFDESYSWNETLRSTSQIIIHAATSDVHPPLYYVLLKFWVVLWGDSTAAMRSLSLLFTMGSMGFAYLIMKQLKNDKALLLGCLLLAISPYQIYFAQEIRMYSLLALLNTASVYFYLKLADSQWKGNLLIVGFIAATLLGLYTHLAALVTFGGIAFHFFYELIFGNFEPANKKKLFVKFCLTSLSIAILYLPWIIVLWYFQAGNVGEQAWRDGVTIFDGLYELSHVITSVFLGMYFKERILLSYDILSKHFTWSVYSIYVSDVVLYIANAAIVLFLTGKSLKSTRKHSLLTFAFFVPLIVTCVILVVVRKHYDLSRYLFSLSPILIILFAIAINELRQNIKTIVTAAIVAVSLICLLKYYSTTARDSDHRPVADVLTQLAESTDKVFLSPASINHMYRYYLRNGSLKNSLLPLAEDGHINASECAAVPDVWLAMDYRSEVYAQKPENLMDSLAGFKMPITYDFFRTKLVHWVRK